MLKKWFDPGKRELKEAKKVADAVFALEKETALLKDEELTQKTQMFKQRYQNGESLDSIMPEAFAVVREASRRVTKLFPYYVQVLGAIAIFHGNIAEMRTGEGKTLTAVMPAYLGAINGEGVHIVTVNEYLAKREAEGDIGDLFRFLGLTVGLNLRDLTRDQKKEAYDCDILYSTNSELGFDYLRDHMVLFAKDMVAQRGLNYAIIDEVDSILIDEARTPLIISGGAKNNYNLYQATDRFAKSLRDEDFEIDIESKSISLTPNGIQRAEQVFQLDNLYDLKHVTLVHHINNALRANYIMSRDKEYVVDNGEVLIVDQFTGRILRGRQFSEGLHQALEAKEGVQIKKETVTVATITYQNFFRMYKKLSGMTGTAKTEEEEFRDIYNMDVVEVPTNAPVIRNDEPDYIYASLEEKFKALVDEVERRHEVGQPMLIGTIAVETSEDLSRMLKLRRIPHEVLNAKNHEREAEIVAKAGLLGSVTIATNMAGRGTDIKLGPGVVALGGLAVIGSERHESRRIDNQLRGRAGRQGDPGYSRFYISAEDELMMRFGGESFKKRIEMLERLNTGGEPLSSKLFSRFVTSAQKRIEGNNYDTRKQVLKYDDVLRKQREIIYKERRDVLVLESIEDEVRTTIQKSVSGTINQFIHQVGKNQFEIDDDNIIATFNGNIFQQGTLQKETIEKMDENELRTYILDLAVKEMDRKKEAVPPEIFNEFLKVVMLRVIDTYWMRHIDAMSELRQGVTLQSYGQQSPLVLYQQEGLRMFNDMIKNISNDITRYAIRAQINYNVEREAVVKNTQTNEGRTDVKPKKPKVKKNRGQRNLPWR
ncbi:MAG: preprotein translocase subunit SecA [Tenericutes bacterium GWE2_38_8]|nr:MAG: preprotein translocase subunit SecA [Tenericutes bacterium GWA2_38_26]OHE32091.1 MAG: preprotein translocase subunit SecA [Tenericutes bacterium GWD2_38_27]OHE35714.1 MAG: preprotein translocase subunit SecA [Tenericutes bacterium GWE2_38_8]HCB66827.1 preprotein translocase subunit SecA [Acholeplasmataceae bacterium]